MRIPSHPTLIRRMLDSRLKKLTTASPVLAASLCSYTHRCGHPSCRCHHGGPLHPLVGLHAVYHLVERLEGENCFLPVLQHVALSNKHIHHPAMGPYALLQWVQKANITEDYVMMSEPDHIFLLPLVNFMKGDDKPAAFPFFYIEPHKVRKGLGDVVEC